MEFHDLPIINSHVHAFYSIGDGPEKIEMLGNNVRQITDECKVEAFAAVSTVARRNAGILQRPISLLLKAMYPDKIYIFGNLDYPREGKKQEYSFYEQAKSLIDIGFDGIKMIEGKPDMRKWTGIPLDSEVYDEFYSYLEKDEIPIIFHVADPDIYWDPVKCPKYARELKWDYLDGTFVSKDGLHKEAEGILTKFPKLNIIFAHFYFMSREPERGGAILDRWKNVSFDITPGSHEYENFALMPDVWNKFFTRYQDRILFGTDSCVGSEENVKLNNDVRRFLETDSEFTFESHGCRTCGIGLEPGVLEKIYKKNFMKYVKGAPKKLNMELALEECYRTREIAARHSVEQEIKDVLEVIINKLNDM